MSNCMTLKSLDPTFHMMKLKGKIHLWKFSFIWKKNTPLKESLVHLWKKQISQYRFNSHVVKKKKKKKKAKSPVHTCLFSLFFNWKIFNSYVKLWISQVEICIIFCESWFKSQESGRGWSTFHSILVNKKLCSMGVCLSRRVPPTTQPPHAR